MDKHAPDLVSVLTNICEINNRNANISVPKPTTLGFPSAKDFRLDRGSKFSKGKKSLFAEQFDERYNFTPSVRKECSRSAAVGPSSFLNNVLPEERMKIEDETSRILNNMTDDEKHREAEKIFKNMDPKLVAFLRKRKKEAQEKQALVDQQEQEQKKLKLEEQTLKKSQREESEMLVGKEGADSSCYDNELYFLNPLKKKVEIEGMEVEVPVYIKPGKHINMGTLEPEKLQWMSDVKPRSDATTEHNSIRFDFDGKIIPKGTEVHTDKGLHHHGEEPSEAGYTIEELFLLSRSAVIRQREVALLTLVHITQRARHAMFHKYVKQPMLKLLLESGVVQLFRHALDTSEYEIALQGLAALLVSPTEIQIQDEVYPSASIYTLQPNTEITKDMDHDTVLSVDVIRLLVESQLPQRLWYLLTKHELTDTLLDNVLQILHHVVQHSLHVTMVIVKHMTLLDSLVELFVPDNLNHFMSCDLPGCRRLHPNYLVIKILRIICSYSKNVSRTMVSRYHLDTVIKLYIALDHRGLGDGIIQMQVECVRLWGVLLQYELCVDVYTAVYPVLVRELIAGGQRSVKLTSTLINTLTEGLPLFPWDHIGSFYQPILTNMLTWANSPPSGSELPPKEDLLLISAVLKFLAVFSTLHHTRHYDVHVIDQVSDLVDKIIRPLVTGSLFDNTVNYLIYTRCGMTKHLIKCDNLPTLQLHQYYQSSPLDLTSVSSQGAQLCTFHACTTLIHQIIRFLAAVLSISRVLSEPIQGFLMKSSSGLLQNLDRLRRYENGTLNTDIPDIIFTQLTQLQYDYVMLAHKANKIDKGLFEEGLLLKWSVTLFSELGAGREYQQFQLLTTVMFDAAAGLSQIFIKSFETTVGRNTIMKSQKFWTQKDTEKSLMIGKYAKKSSINTAWMFLSVSDLVGLPESALLQYLGYIQTLVCDIPGVLASVPVAVQLIGIMNIFLLPSQHFLSAPVSQRLKKFLDHFAAVAYIDFTKSHKSGHPSFYDFFNKFCEAFEAEGYCDPVFTGYILLSTRADYAVTYRRLLWVERIETLRLLRNSYLPIHLTLRAPEADADMMVLYASALKTGIHHIPHLIALHHVNNFLFNDKVSKDATLLACVKHHVSRCSADVKAQILRFDRVNEFNELVLMEKVPQDKQLE